MFALAKKVRSASIAHNIVIYGISLLFLSVCANTKIFLPISPVPITMHTFAILVMGCLLPWRVSLVCFCAYLVDGFLAYPILGTTLLTSATGYYVGMIVSLYFLDKVTQRSKLPLLASLLISSLIIWFFGVFYLQFIIGVKKALLIGFIPFIIGDLLKILAAYSLILLARKKNIALL